MYRSRAHQLIQTAAREWHEDRRRHMLELAAIYQRTADMLAPPPPSAPSSQQNNGRNDLLMD